MDDLTFNLGAITQLGGKKRKRGENRGPPAPREKGAPGAAQPSEGARPDRGGGETSKKAFV